MTKRLRKRHLLIWTILAILIPAAIISAYRVVPKQTQDILLQQDKTIALPVEIKKIERNNFTAFLRSSEDRKNYQLQWDVTNESTAPSILIYQENNNEKELIGRLASKGSYYFSIKADSTNRYNFILYDIIHQQTIDSINFK